MNLVNYVCKCSKGNECRYAKIWVNIAEHCEQIQIFFFISQGVGRENTVKLKVVNNTLL